MNHEAPLLTDSLFAPPTPFPDSSPCTHGLRCGDGSCVWTDQWCDGVPNCRGGQDEANCGEEVDLKANLCQVGGVKELLNSYFY